jgi:hypothetical protein
MEILVTYGLPALLLLAMILATYDCIKDRDYTPGKKTVFILLIYFVPLVGVLSYYVLSMRKNRKRMQNRLLELKKKNEGKEKPQTIGS